MKRDRDILRRYENGEKGTDLAKEYGLTDQRVYDIIKKQKSRVDFLNQIDHLDDISSVEQRMKIYFLNKYEDTDAEKHIYTIVSELTNHHYAPDDPDKFIGWLLYLDETDRWMFRNIGKRKWDILEEIQEEMRNPSVAKKLTDGCVSVSRSRVKRKG